MIKNIKYNLIKRNLLIAVYLVGIFLSYKIFLILYREEASRIDKDKDMIIVSIERIQNESLQIHKVIKEVETIHVEYLKKIEYQKNLTIDSNILSTEISKLVDILNDYYNNTMFKIRLSNVVQNEDYINVAEINFYFEFFHNLQHAPDVAVELEKTVIENVYKDITNNFKNLINIDTSLSGFNADTKTIKLTYIKEK